MVKINLGCGIRAFKGFINVDKFYTEKDLREHQGSFRYAVFEKGAEYVQADILQLPFENEFADLVEMHEVLEHISFRQTIPALLEVYRVMKPKAKLIITTPSFDGLALNWLQMRTSGEFNIDAYIEAMQPIVGNQAGEGETHKCLFTPQFMNACLNSAGFNQGRMIVYPKGAPIVRVGQAMPRIKPHRVFRNDVLVVWVTK